MLALVLVGTLATVVVGSAAALRFDDADPCRDTQPLFVCPEGTVGTSYSIQFKGYGSCGPALPYQYRILSGALPPGLSLSTSGVISGTPTQAGGWRFWVELSDQDPPSQSWCTPVKAEREFSIEIQPPAASVLVTTEGAAPGTIGSEYNLALTAVMKLGSGSTASPPGPLTWTVVSGQLPPGLALAGTGVLSGTPTVEGSFGFTVKAALADGRSDTKALAINVRQPLSIEAPEPFGPAGAPTTWELGVPFRGRLAGTGGSGAYTWSLAEGALPPGLALAADGSLVGRPRESGSSSATIRLADSEGRTAQYAMAFTVAPRLAITKEALKQGTVGRRYRIELVVTGGIAPMVWQIVRGSLPPGVHLDPASGILAGVPTKPGRYRLRFSVEDALHVKRGLTRLLIIRAQQLAVHTTYLRFGSRSAARRGNFRVSFRCDSDCTYRVRLERADTHATKLVRRGRAEAGTLVRLDLGSRRLGPGEYRYTLRLVHPGMPARPTLRRGAVFRLP